MNEKTGTDSGADTTTQESDSVTVTLLAVNLRGLTSKSEWLPPEELEAAEPRSNGQPAEHQEAPPAFEPEPLEPDEVPAEESLQPEMTVRDARDETEEWDETGEPEPPASVDPLEETPEFLEGSPEEDKLWFEQRPPKDFDLD